MFLFESPLPFTCFLLFIFIHLFALTNNSSAKGIIMKNSCEWRKIFGKIKEKGILMFSEEYIYFLDISLGIQ